MRTLLALVLVLSLLAGCSGTPQKTKLDFGSAPANLLEVAKKAHPDVTFTEAYKEPNGSIEFRGKNKTGKIIEIAIRADGTIDKEEGEGK
jgi:hypothetical protein